MIRSKRKIWTKKEEKILKEIFPDNYTSFVCDRLDRSYPSVTGHAFFLGLRKSDEFMKMELQRQAEKLKISGSKSRFAKGHISANKGKKMSKRCYDKLKSSFYKTGHVPHNSKEIGTEVFRNTTCGVKYWMIKIPEKRKFVFKHIYIWEKENGKVKKGFKIIFKDGNTWNCVIENLECITNAELMRRNNINNYPKTLRDVIRLSAKLKRTIYAKE